MPNTIEAYINGKPLNPNRDLPHRSLEQAQAEGLTSGNRLWVRTDGQNTPISAEQISYDSNNSVKDMLDLDSNKAIVSSRSEVTVSNYSVNKVGHLVSFSCSLTISSVITDRNAIIKLPFKIAGICTATIISNANTTGTLYGGNNTDTLVRDIGSIPSASFSVYGSYVTND